MLKEKKKNAKTVCISQVRFLTSTSKLSVQALIFFSFFPM